MMLVFLQNKYIPQGADRGMLLDERTWLRLLWRSHTGKRLLEMLPEDVPYTITESSRQIGVRASDAFEADEVFILSEIERVNPSLILACGRIAHEGLEKLGMAHKFVPHPAWRFLSKEMTSKIREEIKVEYAQNQGVRSL